MLSCSSNSASISMPKYEQNIVNKRSKRLIMYDNVGSILFNIPEISIVAPFNIKNIAFLIITNIFFRNILTQISEKSNTEFYRALFCCCCLLGACCFHGISCCFFLCCAFFRFFRCCFLFNRLCCFGYYGLFCGCFGRTGCCFN